MLGSYPVLMIIFAVLWLLSLFLEVFLTGKSDKLGLLIPIISILIPIGVLIYFIKGNSLDVNSWLSIILSIIPTIGYFAIYRFSLRKKREFNNQQK
jgi:hypothetical protein